MPKVKFLKDLCSGRAGSVHDLQDYETNVLIKLGVAELCDTQRAADENNLSSLLLNLNGSPVIDDFGGLVELPATADIAVNKKAEKPRKGWN